MKSWIPLFLRMRRALTCTLSEVEAVRPRKHWLGHRKTLLMILVSFNSFRRVLQLRRPSTRLLYNCLHQCRSFQLLDARVSRYHLIQSNINQGILRRNCTFVSRLYWVVNASDPNTLFYSARFTTRVYYFISQSVSQVAYWGLISASVVNLFPFGYQDPNTKVQAFPKGLRMLVGDPNSKVSNPELSFICHVDSTFTQDQVSH